MEFRLLSKKKIFFLFIISFKFKKIIQNLNKTIFHYEFSERIFQKFKKTSCFFEIIHRFVSVFLFSIWLIASDTLQYKNTWYYNSP